MANSSEQEQVSPTPGPVHLRVLDSEVKDTRSEQPASESSEAHRCSSWSQAAPLVSGAIVPAVSLA